MASAEGDRPDPAVAFAAVARIVRAWHSAGRTTTTAGVKSALQQDSPGGFDEKSLGFADFRAFVQAGQSGGYFRLSRLPTGHWAIFLPDESPDAISGGRQATAPTSALVSATASTTDAMPRRLRSDVWAAFVEWRESHGRLWDRETKRAFVYPVDEAGRPAWETGHSRFAGIDPAGESVQLGWMREWAASLPAPDRETVTSALADDAPRGEFRRTLTSLGRLPEWRDELQRRVARHVAEWAACNEVAFADLVDMRTFPPADRGQRAAPQGTAPAAQQPAAHRTVGARSGNQTETARLRAILHAVIDAMPLAELAGLEIPAQYLLIGAE